MKWNWPRRTFVAFCMAMAAAGCSNDASRPQQESAPNGKPAGKLDAARAAVAKQAESSSATPAATGLCSLFTQKEVEDILGAPLSAGKVAGPMGTACHWDGSTDADAIFAQVQVLKDTKYWINPAQAKGYEAVKDAGKEAYSIPEQEGWKA